MSNLPKPIAFEWDEGNREKNWIKHKIHFKEAEEVFFHSPLDIKKDIRHSQKENRYVALGKSKIGKQLFIVFTIRKAKIRIISVRKQSNKERKLYEKAK